MSGVTAYISLGSNLGDKEAYLREASEALAGSSGVTLLRSSPVYRTRPVGKVDQDWFLNQIVEIATTLPPDGLLDVCQEIEKRLGRVRHERWGPRTIDLDILVYGSTVSDDPRLTLPHPRMLERAFVLVPLADLAPDLVVAGRTVAEHLARLPGDELAGVQPYRPAKRA